MYKALNIYVYFISCLVGIELYAGHESEVFAKSNYDSNVDKQIDVDSVSEIMLTVTPKLSKDSDVLALINSLKENQSVRLPSFSVVDVYDGEGLRVDATFTTMGPRVRDFSPKWVYSNSRERGIYTGANHGVPHKYNDVWEYDLVANTWVMLHKPDNNVSPHTWWAMTYDQKQERLYWYYRNDRTDNFSNWPLLNSATPPMVVYDPYAQNGWVAAVTPKSGPIPGNANNAAAMEYIPSRDITILYAAEWNGLGMWQFNANDNSWSQMLTLKETYHNSSALRSNGFMQYDEKNDVLVGWHLGTIYLFDFAANQWRIAKELSGTNFDGQHNGNSGGAYDTKNGVHLMFNGTNCTLYIYNAKDNSLTHVTPFGPLPSPAPKITALFYHKSLNVFVFYTRGEKEMIVYRYK